MTRHPVALRDRLEQLVAAGTSDRQIGLELGVHERTILRWRQAAGLESQWRPARAEHGTVACYQNGCKRPECKAAHCAAHTAYVQRMNDATEATATRRYEPWTADDDELLFDDTRGPLLERARLLRRTYGACLQRMQKVRRRQ